MTSDELHEQLSQELQAQPEASTSAASTGSAQHAPSPATQRREARKTPQYGEWWASRLTDAAWLPKVNLWQRFQDQMRGSSTSDGAPSVSGANITLDDIARDPGRPLRSLDDVHNQDFGSNPIDDILNQPSDEWFGEPDPSIYAPGARDLTPEEVEREIAKGNVVRVGEFKRMLENAYTWEKEAASDMLLKHILKERVWVKLDNGKRVSLLDLFAYVHHNPELKALAERNVDVLVEDKAGQLQRAQRPFNLRDNYEQLMSDPAVQAELPWGLVACGDVYKRRPTRWLKGLDGLRDFGYAFYVHEDATASLLGPQYAAKPPAKVLADPAYSRALVEQGPQMGATLMFTTARELPYDEYKQGWTQKLQQTLVQRNPDAGEAAAARVAALEAMLAPERLAGSQLLDSSGKKLRAGTSLLMTTLHNDRLFVQAISPGARHAEREYYQMGTVQDGELCRALLDMFVGDAAIDKDFRNQAQRHLLFYVNGLKMRTAEMEAAEPPLLVPLAPKNPRRYMLPAVGAERASTLVNNVQQRVLHYKVAEAFQGAVAAALAVPEVGSINAQNHARRLAAEQHLRGTLGDLGIDVAGLRLPPPPGTDIMDSASSLAAK